jgi:hypothetical protein
MRTLNATISTYLDAHASIMDCFVSAVLERLPGHIADELRASLARDDEANLDPDHPSSNILGLINSNSRFMRGALVDPERALPAEEVSEEWVGLTAKQAQAAYEDGSNVVALRAQNHS